jgi:hypothetical protein
MPVSRVSSFTNNTTANANDVSAEFNNLITGINANETAIASLSGQTTYAGTRTFSDDVVVNGYLIANDGFLASQGGKPFGYELIPKPVQTASNLFEIKINGTIQATLFSPTATVAPFYKQFTGSNLTVALNGTAGTPNSVDATRVSGAMYYFWLIGKDDGTLDGLFSTSNTAPTMPTGYTWRRLLPWACATYPPIASYTNGVTTITDITTSGREGAFIEHLVGNWGRDGGNNPIIAYTTRFPNEFSSLNVGTNVPTLIVFNKNFNTPSIEKMACLNVALSGQPMWLVPPEVEAIAFSIKGSGPNQLLLGIETFNGSGVFFSDTYRFNSTIDSRNTHLLAVSSREIRIVTNVSSSNHISISEFRCNFTNFWI